MPPSWRNSAPPDNSSPSAPPTARDRKSTRLNSSHLVISYAVFCLKKKKQTLTIARLTSLRPRRRALELPLRRVIERHGARILRIVLLCCHVRRWRQLPAVSDGAIT